MEAWNKKDKFVPFLLVLIFVVMSAGIITAGYLYYSNYKTRLRTEVEKQLSSIGQLKANELAHWREGCIEDGGVFHKNPVFISLARKYFDDPNDQDTQKQLRMWLSSFQAAHQYDRVMLLDNCYYKKIVTPDMPERPESYISPESAEILYSDEIAFEDFYVNPTDVRIYLKVLVPILDETADRLLGVVALRIDPAKYLYPLISTWPVQNTSAETLLVRREGNNVRFLNNLKFKQGAALTLVFSIDENDNKMRAAAQAVMGKEGIVEGIDYRGVPIIADIRAVPHSPWFLVNRIDASEVFSPIRQKLIGIIIFIGALLGGTGACFGLVWRRQRLGFYKKQYESAKEWSTTFDSITDMASIIGCDFKLKKVNKAFADALGGKPEDFVGRHCYELVHGTKEPISDCPCRKTLITNQPAKTEIFHQGLNKYLEVSTSPVSNDNKETTDVIHIVRDITERKLAEEEQDRMLFLQMGINSLQQALLNTTPLEERLKKVTEDIVSFFDADFCRIWLVKDGDLCENGCTHAEEKEGHSVCLNRDQCLHLVSSSGRYNHINGKTRGRVPFGCYKIGTLAASEEHKFITNDVRNDPLVENHQWAAELGLVSFAGYQLKTPGGQPLGVMALFSKYPIKTSEDALLDGISSNVSIAIQQSILSNQLQNSNDKYHGLFENSRDALMTLEPPSFKFTSCNPATLKLFKAETAEEFTSLGPWDLSPVQQPDGCASADKAKEMIGKAMKEGSSLFEWTHKRINGEDFPATVLLTRMEQNGKIFLQATVRDITAQKQAEVALWESQEQYQSLVDNSAMGVAIIDTNHRIIKVNTVFAEMFKKPACEFVGKFCFNEFEKRDAICAHCPGAKALISGKTEEVDTQAVRDDGSRCYVRNRAIPFFGHDGIAKGFIEMVEDIDARKRAEEELLWKTALLESQVEATLDGMLVVDGNDKRILANKRLMELWKVPQHIAEDTDDKALLHYVVSKTKNPEQFIEKVMYLYSHQDETSRDEIEFKDGTVFDRYSSPVVDKNGKYFGRIWAFRDITDRKNRENELKQMNESLRISTARECELAAQAKKASAAKSEFLANMSHEIRTPLNSIIGFTEIMLRDDLSSQHKEQLTTVYNSGRHLLQLINDILDLSKIEAGKMTISMTKYSLADLIARIESMMHSFAAEKGIDFTVNDKGRLPSNILTDSARVSQCLINLVNNAIKFTEKGHVYVNISMEDHNGQWFIRFEVEDTGIGISSEYQHKIFESFSQEDSSTSRQYGGTGLGLAITKKFAELLGGTVTLKSEKGKGSVFAFVIPANIDMANQPPLDRHSATHEANINRQQVRFGGSILIAEDIKSNQMLMKALLEKMGLKTTFADNGAEAVDKVNGESFDLIFMDIHMPQMDGYEATRTIRNNGVKTPIVALTANAMEGDEKKCLDAGCDDYVSKPVIYTTLVAKLNKYLGKTGSPEITMPIENNNHTTQPDDTDDNEVIINWAKVVAGGMDEQMIKEIMPTYLPSNREHLQKLISAVNAANATDIVSHAHAIKGAGRNLGVVQLSKVAMQLETMARQGDLSKKDELLKSIIFEFDRVEKFVSQPDWVEIAKSSSSVKAAQA
jgi:PAS domain S-box-containing protein